MTYFLRIGNSEREAFTREFLCHPKFAEYAKKNLTLELVYHDNDSPLPALPVYSLSNSQRQRLIWQMHYAAGGNVEAVIAQMEQARTQN